VWDRFIHQGDQTVAAHQEFHRRQRKRGTDADLDRPIAMVVLRYGQLRSSVPWSPSNPVDLLRHLCSSRCRSMFSEMSAE
jgi:hypothetical protein